MGFCGAELTVGVGVAHARMIGVITEIGGWTRTAL